MELPSILDWKIDSSDVAKTFYDNLRKQTETVKEMVKQLKPGDCTVWDLIVFAYIQLIPGLLNANVHAQLRTTELLTQMQSLNLRLESLTIKLIWLTVALVALTIALSVLTLASLYH
jgi:hypothetical protein